MIRLLHGGWCGNGSRKPLNTFDAPARRRRSQALRIVMAVLLSLSTFRALAEAPASAFDNANKLYEQGKFVEAATAFEKILQTGQVSEALYFNWGNALFKAGRMGRAIAAYQQAGRISPRDPDVRANLQFARNQVQGPTLLPDRVARWLGKLSLNEWTWLAAISIWLWLLLLTLLQFRPALKPVFKSYTAWLGIVAAILCIGFSAAFYFDRLEQRAIVIDQEAVARQAPIDESQNAFTLHDGAELQVLDQKDQWLQVRVDPRRIGWVRKDSVIVNPSS
jgi:tetratricopeptide (TPR) repeat protein